MFKSNSTRRGHEKYEKLDKEFGGHNETSNEEYLKRSTSVPSGPSNIKTNMAMASTLGDINLQRNPTKKASSDHKEKSTTHPLLNFFDFRRKKKATSKPEFARYVEYLKEGGMWDSNSNKPVIYYK
ncbi:hypothetical protein MtrunA17_Chr5g0404581 [Medicago truncatula]|uniref:Uncharacterized protein n=1 Tax=Medicago truncatula TaxID=3880 RepID=G7KF00_MEDTR|nr:uncharacterized protein LOC11430932 [Medicago truncatula]AES95020.1 hypothetical protein MTR_5g020860 [Medicago truncatula]AFK40054.1 unknown [Medicago truncatula]RHN54242.1 hypothetical protein MtrunA17_Chr5g0404581 [Medicago truncatula]